MYSLILIVYLLNPNGGAFTTTAVIQNYDRVEACQPAAAALIGKLYAPMTRGSKVAIVREAYCVAYR